MSVRAPIGAINIANCQCCIGRGLAALTAKNDVCDSSWLYFALVSRVPEMQKRGTGSTFKAINKSGLQNLLLPKCTLEKQCEIAHRLRTILSLCKRRQQQLDKLDLLAKSRFIELFGELGTDPYGWGFSKLENCCELHPRRPKKIRKDVSYSFVPCHRLTTMDTLIHQ